jgi:NAD(P)-dependent dehydrogenase (short-subunit alcohol dehydrogenase family)
MSRSDNQSFKGKVAIVTGATSGIGKTVAFALADAGAYVVLAGRRAEEGRIAVEAITKSGGKASFFQVDVAKEEDIIALVKFTVEKYGRLDLAFNNAGLEAFGPLLDASEEEFHKVINVNVWGVLASMKHEIAAMLKTGGGSIVNTTSVAGRKGFPFMSIYSASKHAVEGLTKSAALEFATQGIRVNSVAPGPIVTEMLERAPADFQNAIPASLPVKRTGEAREIVPAVLFLLDPQNSFVTGASINVDGGALA